MMIIDGGLLTGPALFILVSKLKRVRVEKGKLDVEFFKVSDGAMAAARSLLRG